MTSYTVTVINIIWLRIQSLEFPVIIYRDSYYDYPTSYTVRVITISWHRTQSLQLCDIVNSNSHYHFATSYTVTKTQKLKGYDTSNFESVFLLQQCHLYLAALWSGLLCLASEPIDWPHAFYHHFNIASSNTFDSIVLRGWLTKATFV